MSDFTEKFKRSTPYTKVMQITPAMASYLLMTSLGNRTTRTWYVKQLAATMRRGEWRPSSQGIGVTKNGHLIDGHHRLQAVVMSGVTITTSVNMGLDIDAYEVIDTGMKRTFGDLTQMPQRIAETIRLGCQFALADTTPTVERSKPILDSEFRTCVEMLVEHCGTSRKVYSTAGVKLAACITILDGGDLDYVLEQYRALCNLDFEKMSLSAQSLVRQVQDGKVVSQRQRDLIARAFKVFDVTKKHSSKIQICDEEISAAIARVGIVVRKVSGIPENKGEIS